MTVIEQFVAHVGLDWADKKHDVCIQFKNGERIFHVIEHTPEALDIWLNELHQNLSNVSGREADVANYYAQAWLVSQASSLFKTNSFGLSSFQTR